MSEQDTMNGAQALASRLAQHGVDTIFALPGEENLAFVEALASVPIELVVTRHEQHAAFMAAAYGRLTGRPGVCLATLGPGALNLFTGLAHAELGGMPLIAITGQKARRDNDEGSFQVIDIPAAARPLTTWATSIDDPRSIVPTIDQAFNRACSGRPGAVLIEIPEDVAAEPVARSNNPIASAARQVPTGEATSRVAAVINQANNVVVLASAGANTPAAAAALTAFAETTGIGVLATQLGKGAISESHELSLRSLGIHRPDYAHLAIEPADVVVCVGYQPVEHPPLAWNVDDDKTIIHIAPWSAGIERGYQPTHQLIGDVAPTLAQLGDLVSPRDRSNPKRIRDAIESLLDDEQSPASYPPSPLEIVRTVRDVLGPDDTVALDNGAYKIWFARHYRTDAPNTLLLDNALATMGAGLATAMTAAHVSKGQPVLAVCGDGGFLMNVQDLETACRMSLDLTVLVVRDDAYGFIGWHQEEQGRDRRAVELGNPDLSALARTFGASAHRVTESNPLRAVLALAVDEPGVSLVDCPIDYSMNELLSSDLYEKAKEAYPLL